MVCNLALILLNAIAYCWMLLELYKVVDVMYCYLTSLDVT